MADATPPERPGPWHSVHGSTGGREPVAPSKPVLPTTGSIPVVPEPIDDEDADVVAPVASPPDEEIMPTSSGAAWSSAPPAEPTPAGASDPARELGDTALRNASLSATDDPGYTPPFGVAVGDRAATDAPPGTEPTTEPAPGSDGADGGDEPPSARADGAPWYLSVPVLVVAGLLVMGGLVAALLVLLTPEREVVSLTPEILVDAPAAPALDPIAIGDPTDFQAALPATVGAYSMTGIETPAVRAADLEVRAAEVDDLLYGDGESELTLRAIQHFDAEDATAQFEAIAADGVDRADVMAGDAPVGQRATLPAESGETLVWRNGTAVFVLTGPADALEDFFARFPL